MAHFLFHFKDHLFHFKVLFLVITIEKSQKIMILQLTEQSCVLKEIRMSKIRTEVAILKKHSEPKTFECATSNLNTLSIKFLNPFIGFFWVFINHGINF